MAAVAEPDITLLELVEALSRECCSDRELIDRVHSMVDTHQVRLIGEFDGRHLAQPAAKPAGVTRIH